MFTEGSHFTWVSSDFEKKTAATGIAYSRGVTRVIVLFGDACRNGARGSRSRRALFSAQRTGRRRVTFARWTAGTTPPPIFYINHNQRPKSLLLCTTLISPDTDTEDEAFM